MAGYKVVMTFSDGEVVDSYEENGEDGIFDTEEDAEDYYNDWMSSHSSDGDYEEPDLDIMEI